MSGKEDFAELKFKIECGEMVLTEAGNDPIELRGPGEIWQDENGVLQFKLFDDSLGYQKLFRKFMRFDGVGQLVPEEDYFTLNATSFSGQKWIAHRVCPEPNEGLDGCFAHDRLHELIYTGERRPNLEFDFVELRFLGRLKFPSNPITHTGTRVGDRDHHTSYEWNAAFIDDGDFHFEMSYQGEHTIVNLRLPVGQRTPRTPSRIREALQFVLGQQLAVMVTEIVSGDTTETRLTSPERGREKMPPPLQFRSADQDGHVWRMFANYFRHIHSDTKSGWHPISCHVGSVIEVSSAPLEVRVLALAVAVEGLAGCCFSELGKAGDDFLEELNAVQEMLKTMKLRSHDRIMGSIGAMRKPRNSDALRAFIANHHPSSDFYHSWSQLRHVSAHGGGLGGRDVKTVFPLQNQVLSLMYSIVFAAINYVGPRTDYSLMGWPRGTWPIQQPAALLESKG